MRAIVAERGQVTIPKQLRDRLGIGPHSVLDFAEENGRLIAVKAYPTDPVEQVRGCLKSMDVDAFVADLRGDA